MQPKNGVSRKNTREAVTIRAVRISVYAVAFALVIALAAGIAWLSVVVAPLESRERGLTLLAISLGGLGVAGGVVYLAEKLISLARGVSILVFELLVEKYKEHRYEIGRKEGREEGREEGQEKERQAWQAWYQRQQQALRDGLPFDEPPPGSEPRNNGHNGA